MDIDTELRVIAELRALARLYGLPGGGMERVDELLDEWPSQHAGRHENCDAHPR